MFRDRLDAGRRLAAKLEHLEGEDLVVLGLPRGGVPVAFEVAQALGAPLDVIVVRKLGVPFQPELAMGAIGEDGVLVLQRDVVRMAGIGERELAAVERRERAELERRAGRFRGGRPWPSLEGRPAVVVDDGIATGSTARAACQVARAQGAGARRAGGAGRTPIVRRRALRRRRRARGPRVPRTVLRRRRVVRGLLSDLRRRGRRPPESGSRVGRPGCGGGRDRVARRVLVGRGARSSRVRRDLRGRP